MPGNNQTFKVSVNDFLFSFEQNEIDAADIVKKSATEFNVIKDHRPVNATVIVSDHTGKQVTVEIDGETFHVIIKDGLDQMLDSMGYSNASAKQLKEIKAPKIG